jgi:hypothetical protein
MKDVCYEGGIKKSLLFFPLAHEYRKYVENRI